MKKILFIAFLFVFINPVVGQTYCYQYKYTVDKKTGVKSTSYREGTVIINYYTFNQNKTYCYLSDENGLKKKNSGGWASMTWTQGENEYQYVGKNNDMYIYRATVKTIGPNPMSAGGQLLFTQYQYLYFSTDYKRLNTWDDKPFGPFFYDGGGTYSTVFVYEQTTPRDATSAPTQMW